jgi:chromosome segregation ATPase
MDCLLRERELDNLRDKHKVQMGSANSSYEDNLRSGLNKRTEELDK